MSSSVSRPVARWVGALASVLAVAVLFADPGTSTVVKGDDFLTAETTGVLNIEAGECFDDPVYSRRAADVVVYYRPCEETADNQSFGFIRVADGPFDRPALTALAWTTCGQRFARLWPDAAARDLDLYPVLPTAETWADGDRTVMCVVYNPRGKLAGSALPRA